MNEKIEASTTAKKPWVKPTLTTHKSGFMNKFGNVSSHNHIEELDGVTISSLIEKYGSPLFVISEKRLRHNYRRLHDAFADRYPNVQMAWSYKTNYLGAVCNTFHQQGSWAEVVSGFEYEKARSLGIPGHHILFNGPHKTQDNIERAITDGAHFHIDHLDELYLIEKVARENNRKVDVTIRLNFDTGFTEPWSRFGFNVESGQAMDAAGRIASSDYLCLTGLHSHIGTFVLEHRAYSKQAQIMCDFMNKVEAETNCQINRIDIGGGFASKNALQGIYLPPEQVVPSYEQYAEAVCDVILEATHHRQQQSRQRPLLILETGRALVDDAEVLLASVFANKRLPDGRRAVILDAGVNALFTAFWYNHQITPTRLLDGVVEETVIYGPLCMNIDVVRASIMLPPVEVGDVMVISPVGAYNNTQWLQFIEYRPPVVFIDTNGNTSIVRRQESLTDITDLEDIPKHLTLENP